ncbi:MAG: PAS domain-containing protein, partial [Bacteroidota bacterium]|nr:PAS domain-containing protein [Bacteroidota bacterium]
MSKNNISDESPGRIIKETISENYFSKIFEYGFDAIIVTDIANNITAWNTVAEKMFGYPAHEILGKPVSEFIIMDDDIRNRLRTTVRATGQWEGEVEILNKEGNTFHTIISISAIKDNNGNITELIGIVKNISENVFLQENLLETSAKLQLIAEEKANFITQ